MSGKDGLAREAGAKAGATESREQAQKRRGEGRVGQATRWRPKEESTSRAGQQGGGRQPGGESRARREGANENRPDGAGEWTGEEGRREERTRNVVL